jgi:hypothetical protein
MTVSTVMERYKRPETMTTIIHEMYTGRRVHSYFKSRVRPLLAVAQVTNMSLKTRGYVTNVRDILRGVGCLQKSTPSSFLEKIVNLYIS